MPFPFMPGNTRGGGIFDLGVDVARRLLQRRPTIGIEPPGTITTPIDPGTFGIPTMPGRVLRGSGCGPCVIEKQMPAYIRKMKGRAVFHPQTGQFLGCTPTRRAINPMNGKAAIRAARRLKGVFKFQRRVEKALQKACRGSGVRRSTGRCKSAKSCK